VDVAEDVAVGVHVLVGAGVDVPVADGEGVGLAVAVGTLVGVAGGVLVHGGASGVGVAVWRGVRVGGPPSWPGRWWAATGTTRSRNRAAASRAARTMASR
jgi:hypothetical protein